MFQTTVGSGGGNYGFFGGDIGLGEGQEVEVHLRCESFGDIGGCYPAGEGVEGFSFLSTWSLS